MQRLLDDFLTRLNATVTAEETWRETLAFLQSLGFDLSMYVCAPPPGPEGISFAMELNNFPDWFNVRYVEEDYAPHDTAVMHCIEQLAPMRMGVEWENADQPPMEWRITNEIADFGYRSAIVYPLRSPGKNRIAGISVANAMKREEFSRFLDERRLIVHVAVTYAHTLIQIQLAAEAAANVDLTPREREGLLWTAMGLTTKAIARKLGISPKAVDFHILNAMRKLKASTRTHAVARAMALGAIQP